MHITLRQFEKSIKNVGAKKENYLLKYKIEMKKPTTPYSIALQDKAQITREFLEKEGWILKEEKPLFERFEHIKDTNLKCSIGLYGGFSIVELHWCNQTPEREFSTINSELSKDDYYNIIRLLNLQQICRVATQA